MKCPRCQHEVNENDHYCSHCGYDLKQKKKSFPLLLFIIVCLVVSIVIGQYQAIINIINMEENNQYELGAIDSRLSDTILYTYENETEFKENISNASTFLTPIHSYMAALNKQYKYNFKTDLRFSIMRNNNMKVTINSYYSLNNYEVLNIEREYTRDKSEDETKIQYKKTQLKTFKEILAYNKDIVSKMMPNDQLMTLTNQMTQKENIFNQKKEKIGHFGIGTYLNDNKYVIYQDGKENYQILIEHKGVGNGKLAR